MASSKNDKYASAASSYEKAKKDAADREKNEQN